MTLHRLHTITAGVLVTGAVALAPSAGAATTQGPPTWPEHPQALTPVQATTTQGPPTWPADPQVLTPRKQATTAQVQAADDGPATGVLIGGGAALLLVGIVAGALGRPRVAAVRAHAHG